MTKIIDCFHNFAAFFYDQQQFSPRCTLEYYGTDTVLLKYYLTPNILFVLYGRDRHTQAHNTSVFPFLCVHVSAKRRLYIRTLSSKKINILFMAFYNRATAAIPVIHGHDQMPRVALPTTTAVWR